MPRTPTTPILTFLDALVSRVETVWKPKTPDIVLRDYQTPKRTELALLKGRHVWFFPATYQDESETRDEDLHTYRIGGLVFERYTGDEGRPPKWWMDELVDFTHTLLEWIDFSGVVEDGDNGPLKIGEREVWTAEIEPVTVYDPATLIQLKAFWGEIELTFQESL